MTTYEPGQPVWVLDGWSSSGRFWSPDVVREIEDGLIITESSGWGFFSDQVRPRDPSRNGDDKPKE